MRVCVFYASVHQHNISAQQWIELGLCIKLDTTVVFDLGPSTRRISFEAEKSKVKGHGGLKLSKSALARSDITELGLYGPENESECQMHVILKIGTRCQGRQTRHRA